VLAGFKAWLDAEALVVLPKAPIADAIGYTRNQWGALTRFLEDARLKLDNNAAERQLRRVAVDVSLCTLSSSTRNLERAIVPGNSRRATGALATAA
jgi:Transposase IS66 family